MSIRIAIKFDASYNMIPTIIGRRLLRPHVETLTKGHARGLTFRKIQQAYQRYWSMEPVRPPYCHVCQVGDPVLRARASPVDPAHISTEYFQKLLERMGEVCRKYNGVGLAAPQIGISSQIFLLEVTKKYVENMDPKLREVREVVEVPRKIFINPTLKIRDYNVVKFPEGCLSILGYSAEIPRYKSVTISALDADGKPFEWEATGWTARIVQHEMDHLTGHLFVDKMNSASFTCDGWQQVNESHGRSELRYFVK